MVAPKELEPTFTFDRQTGQYRSISSGALLPAAEVRDAIEKLIEGAKSEAGRLVEQYKAAREKDDPYALGAFESGMLLLIAALHRVSSEAAVGALPELLRAAESDLEHTVDEERDFLTGFLLTLGTIKLMSEAKETKEGALVLPSLSMLVRRAASYMDAALMTYERQRLLLYRFLGYTHARRVLRFGAEHCESGKNGGCVHQAELGWVPIARFVPLGDEECKQWCECDVEYRKGAQEAAA